MKAFYLIILVILFITPAYSELSNEPPLLKSGRWKIKIIPFGMTASLVGATEIFFCTDSESQPKLINTALNKSDCKNLRVKGDKKTYLMEVQCSMMGQPALLKVQLDVVNEKQIKGGSILEADNMRMNASHEAKYLGKCKTGEVPGSYQISEQEQPFNIPALSDLQGLSEVFSE